MGAAAGRVDDPIAHSHAMAGLVVGLAVGAVAGVVAGALVGAAVIATGGLALVAVAGVVAAAAGGAGVGEVIGSMDITSQIFGANVTGMVKTGSPNVFANGKAVARAQVDIAACSSHGPTPQLVAEGSSTVFVNGKPFARVGDMILCSAKIQSGSPNVFVGGPTDTTMAELITPEVSDEVHMALLVAGVGAGLLVAGPVVVGVALVGGYVGGAVGAWAGGVLFGKGSDGQKAMMLLGAWRLARGRVGRQGRDWRWQQGHCRSEDTGHCLYQRRLARHEEIQRRQGTAGRDHLQVRRSDRRHHRQCHPGTARYCLAGRIADRAAPSAQLGQSERHGIRQGMGQHLGPMDRSRRRGGAGLSCRGRRIDALRHAGAGRERHTLRLSSLQREPA
ncbi:hypothetical protein F1735_09740 [Massilia sp. CCM 8694]|uniref:Uncharacterized protein n=1 Tax=Massilia genomosp. 1 TaxID=2609280 RepID=A0ABX0MT27_9BURK|nr:hypothetical protein [Massilia genomosp. 1]